MKHKCYALRIIKLIVAWILFGPLVLIALILHALIIPFLWAHDTIEEYQDQRALRKRLKSHVKEKTIE